MGKGRTAHSVSGALDTGCRWTYRRPLPPGRWSHPEARRPRPRPEAPLTPRVPPPTRRVRPLPAASNRQSAAVAALSSPPLSSPA